MKKFQFVLVAVVLGGTGLALYRFLLPHMIHEQKRAVVKARATMLNHKIPSFKDLLNFLEGKYPSVGKEYVDYYERVVEFFPQAADAYGMLGFCYFHRGQVERAIAAYTQASTLTPRFFWYPLNLGLIYYREEQYTQAAESLQKAVAIPPQETLNQIKTSTVYRQILSEVRDVPHSPFLKMEEGFRLAYRYLLRSLHQLKNYERMLYYTQMAGQMGLANDGEFYYFAGLAYGGQKDMEQAAGLFQECLHRDPSFIEAYQPLAEALQALGKPELAEKFLKKAEEISQSLSSQGDREEKVALRIF